MGDYWDVTISVLQPLIARPTLKANLLQKPPFRFLTDILLGLMAGTGFPAGMVDESALAADAVKAMDKDAKLGLLNRLIAITSLAVGREIDVSSSKIIAGLEPEKTNGLLQAMAEAGQNAANLDVPAIIAAADAGATPDGSRSYKKGGAAPAAAAPRSKPAPAPAAAPAPPPAAAAPAAASPSHSGPLHPTRQAIALPPGQAGENFVATTSRLIGALIQRPKMTEKLLNKPPFRFLHDIVTGVLSATGYPAGYFRDEELVSGNFGETALKLEFLQKWIDLVAATNAVDLSMVNPKKIAAGLEPEHTNTLLQQFAYAAASGIDARDLAARMAGGAQAAAPPPAAAAPANNRAAEAEAAAAAERKAKAAADAEARKHAALAASAQAQQQQAEQQQSMPKLGLSGIEQDPDSKPADDQPRRVERPKTARKAPPKLASNLIDEGRKGALAGKGEEEKKAELGGAAVVIAEGDNAPEDDDDSEDDVPQQEALGGFGAADGGDLELHAADGMVVRAMKGKLKEAEESGGMRIRSAAPTSSGLSGAQLEALRREVQSLCQGVHPLGRVLEHAREDLDAMHRELTRWRAAYGEYTEQLEAERKQTDTIVQPLQQQLQEVEQQIAEQQRKIHSLKGSILRNDSTIAQLLDSKTAVQQ